MKIRTGFVSNSSSSSFIVAFNKVPESPEEMLVTLWGADPVEDTVLPVDLYSAPVTYEQAAALAYENMQEAEREDLVELFSQRYESLYFKKGTTLPKNQPKIWYGVDKELFDKFNLAQLEEKELHAKWEKEEDQYLCEKLGPRPQAREEGRLWVVERNKLYDSDKQFKKLNKKHQNEMQKIYDKVDTLSRASAERDVAAFLEDNKDKAIRVFVFSDNRGTVEANLEHGDTFKRFTHIVVNHH